jgi:hypothetical protein
MLLRKFAVTRLFLEIYVYLDRHRILVYPSLFPELGEMTDFSVPMNSANDPDQSFLFQEGLRRLALNHSFMILNDAVRKVHYRSQLRILRAPLTRALNEIVEYSVF